MTWQQAQLKYVTRFNYGDALPSSDEERTGSVKVYGSNGPYAQYWQANTSAPVIVVGRKGSYGKINWSDEPVFASDTTFFVDKATTQHHLRWLFYALQTLNLDEGSNEAAVPGLNRDNAYQKFLFVPPLPEQRAIAAYLDRETAQLDALIAAKEELLTLLAEKRRALITHAVTRGLNPAAPLRDSGVEWLGGVPAHWEVARLKNVSQSLQTGPFGTQLHAEDYIDNGTPVINPAHLISSAIVPNSRVTVDDATVEQLAIHKLRTGDIIFARRGDIGRCALVTQTEAGWLCGTGSLRARLNKELVVPKYLALIISNTFAATWLSIMSVGTTMQNLNTEIIGELMIPLPPIEEQQEIVAYLDTQKAKIDDLQNVLQETLKLLNERRTALISAAVSGQIRVAG